MADKKAKIPLTGVVKIPEPIDREIDMEASRLGVFKYEVVLAAWSAYRNSLIAITGESVARADDGQNNFTGMADKGVIQYASSEPLPPEQTDPDKSDPEVESWLAMLRYILTCGDTPTKDAITRILERFRLLAQTLNQEVLPHERGGEVPKPSADQQKRMDRMREFGARYTGGGVDNRSDEGPLRSDVSSNSQGTGRRRKH